MTGQKKNCLGKKSNNGKRRKKYFFGPRKEGKKEVEIYFPMAAGTPPASPIAGQTMLMDGNVNGDKL